MNHQKKTFEILASACQARLNCLADEAKTGKSLDWTMRHKETINQITSDFMPSGSGIDTGTKFDFDRSNGDKLVFTFGYHHMNDGGYYDGWTDHVLTVTPSLQFGISLSISGRNRNDIKEYLHEVYHGALTEVLDWDKEKERYFSPAMREAQKAYQESLAKEATS